MQLTLFVNHRCNLRCSYCYTGRKFHRAMSLAMAQRAVDFGIQQADQGFLILSFFGGEPFLEMDLLQSALAYAQTATQEKGLRLITSVATNATMLTPQAVRWAKENQVQVQVSLDGCPEAQDATRRFRNGRSSYQRVEAGLLRLLQTGFSPRVIAVVDPANARFMGPSFDHLMDLGVRKIQYSPNYTGAWDDQACDVFESALEDLGRRYMARLRAGQDVRLDPLNGKIVTHLSQGYEKRYICHFGQKEIAVSPSGRLYPCDRLVGEDTNVEVCIGDLDRGLDQERVEQMVQAKNTPDPECAACELRPRCMFWCGCANYETTGNVGQVSPIVCWFERCFIAQGDRVANRLFSENVPAFFKRFYVPEGWKQANPSG